MSFLRVIIALCAYLASMTAVMAEEDVPFECQYGVPYVENDCNYCFCGPDGSLACTKRRCTWTDYMKECTVGLVWQQDECNLCWCAEDIGTICTGFPCDSENYLETESTYEA